MTALLTARQTDRQTDLRKNISAKKEVMFLLELVYVSENAQKVINTFRFFYRKNEE